MKSPSLSDLTPRQREVLHWLAEGKTNWETGQIIGCKEETSKKHRRHIYHTLGVANAISAAAFYWQARVQGSKAR
jgi:DNA-binding CsgD family transcriptional regulator